MVDGRPDETPVVPDVGTQTSRLGRPDEGERKLVTVLFIDIAHSSDFVADADPEDANDILLPLIEGFAQAVRSLGGSVTQVLGDGVMAVFGAPAAIEDHALRACHAAARIREMARTRRLPGARRKGMSFEVRIGISSGEVIAQTLRLDRWPEYRTAGEAVYLAARMERLARPNEIWTTEDTVALIGGNARIRRIGMFPLAPGSSGKTVYELVEIFGTRSIPEHGSTYHPAKVHGRQSELRLISETIAHCLKGKGGNIVVSGEAGIGKSRLVEELIETVRDAPCRAVTVGGAPPGFGTPNEDLVALVRLFLRASGGVEPPDIKTAIHDDLAGFGLGEDERIDDLVSALGAGDDAILGHDADEQFDRAISLLRDAVAAISREIPILVIVEDFHWASSVLRRFVVEVGGLVGTLPIALVVTTRDSARESVPQFRVDLFTELGPLPESASRSLLTELLGRRQELANLKELVIRAAQGNPLFIVENAAALAESGVLRGDRGAYRLIQPDSELCFPPTIRALLAARLDSLPPRERSILLAASVIGQSFDVGLLRNLLGEAQSEVATGLYQLREKGFVEKTRTLPSTEFSFRHALIHEVAYGTLLRAQRRKMHKRLVVEIRRRPQSRIFGKTALLADHSFRAEEWGLAFVYNQRAGEIAQDKSWNIEAERFLRHSLEALDLLPKNPKRDYRRLKLVASHVRSLFALGRYDEARNLLPEVTAGFESVAASKLGCEIASLWVVYHWARSSLLEAETAARAAYDIAQEQQDVGLLVSCKGRLGAILADKGDFSRGYELLMSADSAIPEGRYHEKFGLLVAAPVALRGVASRCLAEQGEHGSARELSFEGIELADDIGHIFSQIYANVIAGCVLIRGQCFEQSLPFLDRALDLSHFSRFSLVWPLITGFIGVAKSLAGSVDEGVELLNDSASASEIPPLIVPHSVQRVWLAEGFLAAGSADVALAISSPTLVAARNAGERAIEAQCLRIAGESTLGLPDANARDAASLVDQARELAEELGMRPLIAHCHIVLGRLDDSLGRHEAAGVHFGRAADIHRSCGMPPVSVGEREADRTEALARIRH